MTPTEAQCHALVEAMWTYHAIIAAEDNGRAVIEVRATVPPLRGMTMAACARASTIGRAWRPLLATLRKLARESADAHAARAQSYDVRASQEREQAARILAALGGAPAAEVTT